MDRQKGSTTGDGDGTITHEVRDGILRVIAEGPAVLQTVTTYAVRHQDLWAAHQAILWDLRKLDPSRLSSQDVLNIDQAFAEVMTLKPGGQSAILINKELDLVARIAIALGERQGTPVRIRSFLKEKEAINWLQSG